MENAYAVKVITKWMKIHVKNAVKIVYLVMIIINALNVHKEVI